MADINRELEELAELTQRVNAEFARYGQLTRETAEEIKDAEMKKKYGIENYTAATTKGAEAVVNLGKAMGQAASAMYQGKKGAAAFNDSVDSLTTAATAAAAGLALLAGPLGLLAAAVTGGIAALGKYTQAANEMSDKLYKGYQGLAESGAAASDGMTGLFEDAKKLSLSMNDLDGYVQLIAENSKDLALFGGTVFEGRKQFANMGKSMEKYQESLFNMGLSVEQVNAGMMSYLRLQSRVGLSQNKTTDQLADGARKYLIEMDELTKVTGVQRKEAEQIMEAGRNEQRFRAKLDAMRATNDERQIAAAAELEKANVVLTKLSPELGAAFRDLQSGAVTSAAAIKGVTSSQGELLRSSDMLRNGQINYLQLVQRVGTSVGEFNKSLNMTAQLGALNDWAIDYAQGQELAIFARKDLTEQEKIAKEELLKQGGKGGEAADALVGSQSKLRQAQIAANNATERFVFAGVKPATDAMIGFAKATAASSEALNKAFGIGKSGATTGAAPAPSAQQVADKKELDEAIEKAKLANERARAAEKDANTSREEKDRVKKEARDSEAAVVQAGVKQREKYLLEKRERKQAAAGVVAPAASPASVSPAAPPPSPTMGGFNRMSGASTTAGVAPVAVTPAPAAAPAASGSSAPTAKPAAPAAGYDGKPTQGGTPAGAATAESGVQMGNAVKIGNEIRKDGTVSWRTNNPGNISYAGITKKHGAIGAWKKPDGDPQQRTTGIAIMPSLEAGENVQMDQWRRPSYIDLSIDAAVNRWTGQHSGLGSTYAKDLAKAAGVDLATTVRELSDDQLRKLVKKQAVWEGFKPGTVVSAADGGMFSGPKSGYSATLHGTEAVIPLKNGAVPVSLSMTDVLGGLSEDISEQLKEIKDQTVSANDTALRQVTSEFKTAMAQLSQQLSENAKSQNRDNMTGIAALLEELVSATKSGVSVQQKILASNY